MGTTAPESPHFGAGLQKPSTCDSILFLFLSSSTFSRFSCHPEENSDITASPYQAQHIFTRNHSFTKISTISSSAPRISTEYQLNGARRHPNSTPEIDSRRVRGSNKPNSGHPGTSQAQRPHFQRNPSWQQSLQLPERPQRGYKTRERSQKESEG